MKLTYIRSSQKINKARTVDLKLLTYHLDSNDAASPISIKLQLVDIPFTILICSHYFRTKSRLYYYSPNFEFKLSVSAQSRKYRALRNVREPTK
jgi:hypothetical protein